MTDLTTEEHVDKYFDNIDLHSLKTSLQITSRRHKEEEDVLTELKGLPDDDEIKKDWQELVERNRKWRERVEARIKEIENE